MSLSTTQPAVIDDMLLLKVPAWATTFGRLVSGLVSNWSSNSARPPNAPNENPPPMYLPKVLMSGCTPSKSNIPLVPWREVMTSSAMVTAPTVCARANTCWANFSLAGTQPPEPSIGSITTAANDAACSSITARALAVSLYGAITK